MSSFPSDPTPATALTSKMPIANPSNCNYVCAPPHAEAAALKMKTLRSSSISRCPARARAPPRAAFAHTPAYSPRRAPAPATIPRATGSNAQTPGAGGTMPPPAHPAVAHHRLHQHQLMPAQHAGWMPHDLAALERFLKRLTTRVNNKKGTKAAAAAAAAAALPPEEAAALPEAERWEHESVRALSQLVEDDPVARMLLQRAMDQAPRDMVETSHFLNTIGELLDVVDHILGEAPEYATDELVGCPINAALALLMGTPAGFEAFRWVSVGVGGREGL